MERIRLNNIINRGYAFTEVHPVWPYASPTFLSPILPAPNVPLPYPIPGALPIQAMPIFQNLTNNNPLNVTSNSNSTPIMVKAHIQQPQVAQQKLRTKSNHTHCANYNNNNCNSSNNNSNNNAITNNSNIQNITKNASVASKSPTDSIINVKILTENTNFTTTAATTTTTIATTTTTTRKADLEIERTTETKPSPIPYDSNSIKATDGDNENDSSQLTVTNTLCLLSPLKFNELARLALKGSEIAEKLAHLHRNRPCFKKIDSLCARMKQDLIRPDGVLPNINSQGIAWAVKDFIFVFTRVINAWIIIKGYVYNTPEGLNKIKQALSPEFVASFAAWQDATLDFIENLIKSFVNLNNLVQSQKSAYQKTENASCRTSSTTLLEDSFEFLSAAVEKVDSDLSNNNLFTMVEDSENSQRQATLNGTYFKTGTYKPIKKDMVMDNQAATAASTYSTSSSGSGTSSGSLTPISLAQMSLGGSGLQQYIDAFDIWSSTDTNTPTKSELYSLDDIKLNDNKHTDCWLKYDLRVLEEHQLQMDEAQERGKNFIDKLNTMIDRLMTMKNADLFFKLQFTKNYFPEFIARHNSDFMDVRSIILKCQVGGYNNIYEVVHDVKKIIYAGKEFLKFNQDQKLCYSVKAFEAEFNALLMQPPFNCYNFEHINGEPDESLY